MSDIKRRLALVSDDLLAVDPRYSAGIATFKRAFIKQAMIAHNGNQSETVAAFGIHRNTLSRAMDECNLTVQECRQSIPWKKPPVRELFDYRLSLERKA